MFTAKEIQKGIEKGLVQFVWCPDDSCTVCKIGEYWFYFGGLTAEELMPEEWVVNVPIEDSAAEIADTLNDMAFHDEFIDECNYYKAILKGE